MIDTHIHMVPGVDDGAKDLTVAMAMVKDAMAQGVDEMVLTPHHNVPVFVSEEIDAQFEVLKQAIEKEGLDFNIHLGNEIHVNEESVEGLETGAARTMGDSDYVLMELPFHHYYPFHEAMLFDLQVEGYKVIIAHIERYHIFRKNEQKLGNLIDKGFYGQLTSRYVAEAKTRKRALRWIEEGFVHIIASDGHNIDKRPPIMKAAYDVVESRFGRACADTLFTDNPKRIINNIPLERPKVSKSGIFGLRRLIHLTKK